jgi:sortase A
MEERRLSGEKAVAQQASDTKAQLADELTIQELQALLDRKRLALRKERLGRIEEEQARARHETIPPTARRRPPATDASWLSDEEFERRFGPWRLGPQSGDHYQDAATRSTRRRSWWDRFLLALEVLALLGLAFVVTMSVTTLREMNHETTQVTATATPTEIATPLPTLPGSSLSPRESHLPPFYQGLVQPANPVPLLTPTFGPQAAIRIVIDRIRVDAPVVEGDDWESLKKGVGHHTGSANPGQRGTVVVSAHNDVFGEIFRDLNQLEPGDEVLVFTQERSYRYVVTETLIVEPTEVDVLEPTHEPILTLITCYPYMVDTHRVVVVAELAP